MLRFVKDLPTEKAFMRIWNENGTHARSVCFSAVVESQHLVASSLIVEWTAIPVRTE